MLRRPSFSPREVLLVRPPRGTASTPSLAIHAKAQAGCGLECLATSLIINHGWQDSEQVSVLTHPVVPRCTVHQAVSSTSVDAHFVSGPSEQLDVGQESGVYHL